MTNAQLIKGKNIKKDIEIKTSIIQIIKQGGVTLNMSFSDGSAILRNRNTDQTFYSTSIANKIRSLILRETQKELEALEQDFQSL